MKNWKIELIVGHINAASNRLSTYKYSSDRIVLMAMLIEIANGSDKNLLGQELRGRSALTEVALTPQSKCQSIPFW